MRRSHKTCIRVHSSASRCRAYASQSVKYVCRFRFLSFHFYLPFPSQFISTQMNEMGGGGYWASKSSGFRVLALRPSNNHDGGAVGVDRNREREKQRERESNHKTKVPFSAAGTSLSLGSTYGQGAHCSSKPFHQL